MSTLRKIRIPAIAWLALLVLLGLTCFIAYLPLGNWNLVIGLVIAATKTGIVLVFFMKLPKSPPLAWIYAAAGLFWLMIMLGLSASDYLTRVMLLATRPQI
jgi:cytochrome c oxidase subunit 4